MTTIEYFQNLLNPPGRRRRTSRKIANNTYVRELITCDGYAGYGIRLHETDIIMVVPDGKVYFDHGGWQSNVTRDRISEHLHKLQVCSGLVYAPWSLIKHNNELWWRYTTAYPGVHGWIEFESGDSLHHPFPGWISSYSGGERRLTVFTANDTRPRVPRAPRIRTDDRRYELVAPRSPELCTRYGTE